MPNIKSQIKRDKQNKKRTLKNRVLKSRIKTTQKDLIEMVESKDAQKAQEALNKLNKALDKAVKNSAVHKNYAANKKSSASKLLNSIKK
jgi:small subunit ribosomal protein S20